MHRLLDNSIVSKLIMWSSTTHKQDPVRTIEIENHNGIGKKAAMQ